MPPSIDHVVETCLYVDDVETAADWYERVLGLEPFAVDPPRHVFLVAGDDDLVLLFDPNETETADEGDKAPPHGARGPQHVAFAVEDLPAWRDRLAEVGVEIMHEASWGEGDSVYLEDPSGNILELVSRGTWPVW